MNMGTFRSQTAEFYFLKVFFLSFLCFPEKEYFSIKLGKYCIVKAIFFIFSFITLIFFQKFNIILIPRGLSRKKIKNTPVLDELTS